MAHSDRNNKNKQKKQYPFERFASVRRYIDFDFKNPSWMLYVSDTNGQFNLWRQSFDLNFDGYQCSSYPLTNFVDNSVRRVFSSPVDNSVVFFADHNGNENFQIYKIEDVFNCWPEQITFKPQTRHEWGSECFSHDGKYIAYGSNEKDPSSMLVHVRNMKSDNDDSFCVTDRGGWYVPGYWSPNNKKLNCSQLVTLADYSVWILDVESRRMEKIDLGEEKSRFIVGPWSPDGNGFYVLSDSNREFIGIAFYHIGNSQLEWIATPQHDVELIDICLDGKLLAWTENVDGYSKLYVKDLDSQKVKEVALTLTTDTAAVSLEGVIEKLKLSPDGKRIGFMMDCPTSPTNVYVVDIDRDDEYPCTRVTTSLLGNLSENMLIKPQVLKYKSFDSLEISAYFYKPFTTSATASLQKTAEKNGIKFGAVLSLHGGPTAQERPYYDYSGLYQYLAHNGLAVIAPNFRGSTGYGKSFEKKIYHDWGGNELKDIEHAINWLLSQDWVDPKRIGVFGGSFGGFATLSCITRLPQYSLRAAVDIVGPSNLVTFLKTVPEHWKGLTFELVGDPEKEERFLNERSPITFVDSINPVTSLLVIQGANDPRVAKSESDQIVKKLNDKGLDVDYMVFEDEGHGFTKYSNQIKALKKSAEFLVEKLS
jgi:dipeptidyl aminopeptidase/acylaminoacyl peptidase